MTIGQSFLGSGHLDTFNLWVCQAGNRQIEDQADFITSGKPRRKFVKGEDGEIEFDDNEVSVQRHSFEMSWGLAKWLKVTGGVEFEEERVDDPPSFAEAQNFDSFKATEIQFEGVAVLVPVEKQGIGLGVYAELQLPTSDEARTLFFGPIVQAISGPWSATGNFALVKFMGGEREFEETEDGEEARLPLARFIHETA